MIYKLISEKCYQIFTKLVGHRRTFLDSSNGGYVLITDGYDTTNRSSIPLGHILFEINIRNNDKLDIYLFHNACITKYSSSDPTVYNKIEEFKKCRL